MAAQLAAVALALACILVAGGCLEARPPGAAVVPGTIGIISDIDDEAGGVLAVTLEDGRVLRFGPGAARLTDQPPLHGVLLLAGEDVQGPWLMPVGGGQGIFVLHGTGYDEGRRIVVRPDPPFSSPGPARLVSLAKGSEFSGGSHEERGIYDSPTGTFILDAGGFVLDYMP